MSITIKPVTIEAFDILSSVGDGGSNDGDDVFNVKTLLNGIERTRGGAEKSLNADDTASGGPESAKTVAAIVVFQQHHFAGQFTADGLVEPGRSTLKRLKEEFFRQVNLTSVSVSEGAPLSGFSKLRLKRSAGEFTSDPGQPLCQMVPVGGSRNLLISTGSNGATVGFRLPASPHVSAFTAPGVITVRGLTAGEDLAQFTINGATANTIRLIVRPAADVITVHFQALADASGKGATGFSSRVSSVVQGLNRLYGNQANVRFKEGSSG